MLDGNDMAEAMGVDAAAWSSDHPNGMNAAVLQQRYKDKSWRNLTNCGAKFTGG